MISYCPVWSSAISYIVSQYRSSEFYAENKKYVRAIWSPPSMLHTCHSSVFLLTQSTKYIFWGEKKSEQNKKQYLIIPSLCRQKDQLNVGVFCITVFSFSLHRWNSIFGLLFVYKYKRIPFGTLFLVLDNV